MARWQIKNGDDRLKAAIKSTKDNFEQWRKSYCVAKQYSREQILNGETPLENTYYKMTKSFEEVKAKFPLETKEQCDCCKNMVDIWVEMELNLCEYSCGLILCQDCVNKMKHQMD